MKAATLVSVLPHVPMFRSCIRNLVCCCVRMYQFSFLSSRRRAVGWNQPTYDRAIPPVHTHTCTSSLSPSLPLSLLPFFPSSLLGQVVEREETLEAEEREALAGNRDDGVLQALGLAAEQPGGTVANLQRVVRSGMVLYSIARLYLVPA